MLCAPLDSQYAESPSSASDAVLCTMIVCQTSNQIKKIKKVKFFVFGLLNFAKIAKLAKFAKISTREN